MAHEQQRRDRDHYVQVNWQTVLSNGYEAQFKKKDDAYEGSSEAGDAPYDFDSIMHYGIFTGMHTLPLRSNGKGVHDSRVGQRRGLSPLDVVQLRDMYQCDRVGAPPCVDDERVSGLFTGEHTCSSLKRFCNDERHGKHIRFFCAKTCDACPKADALPTVRSTTKGCQDSNAEVCSMLVDYCPGPGALSGHEQYMSSNCRKTCCLPQVCNGTGCVRPSTAKNGPTASNAQETSATSKEPPENAASMIIRFISHSSGSNPDLENDLKVRFFSILGEATIVQVLKAPECKPQEKCTAGEARVSVLCGCDKEVSCSQSCAEVDMMLAQLTAEDLSAQLAAAGRGGKVIIVEEVHAQIDFNFENLPAWAMQHRNYLFLAASIVAAGLLCSFFSWLWGWWWRSMERKVLARKTRGKIILKHDGGDALTSGISASSQASKKSYSSRSRSGEEEEDEPSNESSIMGTVRDALNPVVTIFNQEPTLRVNEEAVDINLDEIQRVVSEKYDTNKEELFEEYGGNRPAFKWCQWILLISSATLALLGGAFMVRVGAWWAKSEFTPAQAVPKKSSGAGSGSFMMLGCYPLLPLDDRGAGTPNLYDASCVASRGGSGRCRSGLPFYRLTLRGHDTPGGSQPEIGWRVCAEFCLQKGLGISGVLDSVECRCGASLDQELWQGASGRRAELSWQPRSDALPSSSDQSCRIIAAKFVGKLPSANTDLTQKDLVYIASVLRGSQVRLHSPPPSAAPALSAADGLRTCGALGESSQRCAAGWAWPTEGGIPFSFEASVPKWTRDVFLEATSIIARVSCISFREVSAESGPKARIRVSSAGDGCTASSLGYSSSGVDLVLGWCSTRQNLGAVLHELGHVLGMTNEELRPDRSSFVAMGGWRAPAVNAAAYVGSASFGPAPYDLSSVMHTSAHSGLTSKPEVRPNVGVNDPQLGQRDGLSPLDILQLRDMYHCDGAGSSAAQSGCVSDLGPSGLCRVLISRCPASARVAQPGVQRWLAERCQATCRLSQLKSCAGSSTGGTEELLLVFTLPAGGFDLNSAEERQQLGEGLAHAIASALGAARATAKVEPSYSATVEVTCGCAAGSGGGDCIVCSALEDRLRHASADTVSAWLAGAGLAGIKVTEASKRSSKTWAEATFDNEGLLMGACVIGAVSAVTSLALGFWLVWWSTRSQVDAVPKNDDEGALLKGHRTSALQSVIDKHLSSRSG
eukprot:TRINITY_DN3626_c1_g2_i1.p1 TRINITY_DN3626_c1_g2~~TRINITY_DN3626_c1_g2_i1.p1  ORF type:complete len:1392 (-),score=233.38 TRINITY_DN3626_c1_g2_i1:89-3712(-)